MPATKSKTKSEAATLQAANRRLRSLIENDEPLYAGNGSMKPTDLALVGVDDDSWRDESIANLARVTANDVSCLAEHTPPITTVGELADFTGDPYRKLTDIKGIGPAAEERINAGLDAFWTERKAAAEEADDAGDGVGDEDHDDEGDDESGEE